ncbi:Structural maintenance of chromosomes flexible hinge domain-containing protein [Trichinella spiralis]|uniref:Structural maintenance of chromosomes flexible hinge domain-containing protein n=1 Tax=Trichinella spiralis TaxID=6334 RepID=A0ABR3K6E4_TRISP
MIINGGRCACGRLVACIVTIIDALASGHRSCVRPLGTESRLDLALARDHWSLTDQGKMEAIMSIFGRSNLQALAKIYPSIHWQSIRPCFELRKAPTAHIHGLRWVRQPAERANDSFCRAKQ